MINDTFRDIPQTSFIVRVQKSAKNTATKNRPHISEFQVSFSTH